MRRYGQLVRASVLLGASLSLGACVMEDGDYGPQQAQPQPVYAPAPQPVYVQQPQPVYVQQPVPVYVQQPVPVYVQQPPPVYLQPAPVVVVEPPPPLPVYEQPPCPAPGYLWTPGHWGYRGGAGYFWVPGTWARPPQPNLYWTPGYWSRGGNGFVYHDGYWGPHVGYYGGINYGHGYVGSGYEGGRWNNGRFEYNAAVNNVDRNIVRTIYQAPVTRPVSGNRYSYDRSDGRRSAEERTAEGERHFGPADEPIRHEHEYEHEHEQEAGSGNGASYGMKNHGKPEPVAMPHPVAANPGEPSATDREGDRRHDEYPPAQPPTVRKFPVPPEERHPLDAQNQQRLAERATRDERERQQSAPSAQAGQSPRPSDHPLPSTAGSIAPSPR